MAPERLDWKIEGYVAGGLITILASKPKVGKTTLVCAGITAMAQGVEFLGRRTSSCPVVYLTEENPTTFCEVLSRTGVTNHGSVTIVPRAEAYGLSWEDIIEDVHRLIDPLCKVLLVVDTLTDWVNPSSDWENSSSTVKEVMRPLKQIASEGHAVLGLFHQRKSGGGIQDSIRGSTAFAGDADIIVGLDERKGFTNGRIISAVGRPTATPRLLQVEFDGTGFQLTGEPATSKRDEAEREILAMLPADEAEAMLLGDIKSRVSCSGNTVDRVLEHLVTAGIASRKEARTSNNRRTTAYWRSQDG